MLKKWLGPIVVIGLFTLPLVVKSFHKSPTLKVVGERASLREINTSVLASGSLTYQELTQLSAEVTGKVSEILVREGDHVDKGQVVLRLDDQSYSAAVEQQRAAVRQQEIQVEQQKIAMLNQQAQFRRKLELHRLGFISDAQQEDAQYARDAADASLRNSREGLQQAQALLVQAQRVADKTIIRAPLSGTITAIDVRPGETAIASQIGMLTPTLMSIANTTSILAEVNIDEADISAIKVGQQAKVALMAYPGRSVSGVVSTIPLAGRQQPTGQTNLPKSRTYPVQLSLNDTSGLLLRAGMRCRAEIFTKAPAKLLSVPLQAVFVSPEVVATTTGREVSDGKLDIDSSDHVLILKDGHVEQRNIRIGVSDDAYQAVLSGLREGDWVITGPYRTLRHLHSGDAAEIVLEGEIH